MVSSLTLVILLIVTPDVVVRGALRVVGEGLLEGEQGRGCFCVMYAVYPCLRDR